MSAVCSGDSNGDTTDRPVALRLNCAPPGPRLQGPAPSAPRQLKAREIDGDQTEAITEAVRAGVVGGVATKADLAEVRIDITVLRTELRWMKAIGGVIVALLVWMIVAMRIG